MLLKSTIIYRFGAYSPSLNTDTLVNFFSVKLIKTK